jgi:hypothetical protein
MNLELFDALRELIERQENNDFDTSFLPESVLEEFRKKKWLIKQNVVTYEGVNAYNKFLATT